MCEPATIGMMVVSAAGALAQNSAMKKQARQQEQAYTRDRNLKIEAQNKQAVEAADATAQDLFTNARDALKVRSSQLALNDYLGKTGTSAARVVAETGLQETEQAGIAESNYVNNIQQINLQARATENEYASNMNSITRPSGLATGLQIANAGLSAYSTHQQTEALKALKTNGKSTG